jgi:multiple sugar transport system ATP-binding protein
MPTIELSHVSKVYGAATLAVDDVSLNIGDREFVVLIGPSGCGKSTLLRMLAGLEDVTAGDVLVDGRRMNDVHPKNRDVSMVFQNYALYPHMSVAQNISFGLRLRRAPRPVVQEKVGTVADALGLTPYLDRPPAELSGGQRQRVALARAMVQDSRIFLMDEPLSNLDAKLRSTMRAEILDLHRSLGVTTVYVTHDQVEAMTMADRVVLLRDGVVVQQGSPRELYRHPVDRFVATFLGEPEINLLPAVRDGGGAGRAPRATGSPPARRRCPSGPPSASGSARSTCGWATRRRSAPVIPPSMRSWCCWSCAATTRSRRFGQATALLSPRCRPRPRSDPGTGRRCTSTRPACTSSTMPPAWRCRGDARPRLSPCSTAARPRPG